MALRATIYKIDLHIADIDRNHYGDHFLTIARHPSETEERMMVRVLAYALNAHDDLAFTRGLSEINEPDIWRKDPTGDIAQWIEIGQPDERRILKAAGRAHDVTIYSYGGNSRLWWEKLRPEVERVRRLRVMNLPTDQTGDLARLAQRTMTLHVNIQEGEAYLASEAGEATVKPEIWREFG